MVLFRGSFSYVLALRLTRLADVLLLCHMFDRFCGLMTLDVNPLTVSVEFFDFAFFFRKWLQVFDIP